MSHFISHRVIARQILGISEKSVLEMMKSGIWGDTYKPTPKLVLVEREKVDHWIEQHKKPVLKKAS